MPHVEHYGNRIRELLDQALATDERNCLTPPVLDLSPGARAEWVRFHDQVERQLGTRGRFRAVRDVAAKAAENVARLAALFHVLEHGPAGTIGADEMAAAGPNCVRDCRDLRAALAILTERGRARMEEDGRRRVVTINPALLVDRQGPSTI